MLGAATRSSAAGSFRNHIAQDGCRKNSPDPKELSLISDALDQLAKVEPELAELVDLKFFCGFTFAEIAGLRNLSERTVQRNWEKARIFLHRNIRADLPL